MTKKEKKKIYKWLVASFWKNKVKQWTATKRKKKNEDQMVYAVLFCYGNNVLSV